MNADRVLCSVDGAYSAMASSSTPSTVLTADVDELFIPFHDTYFANCATVPADAEGAVAAPPASYQSNLEKRRAHYLICESDAGVAGGAGAHSRSLSAFAHREEQVSFQENHVVWAAGGQLQRAFKLESNVVDVCWTSFIEGGVVQTRRKCLCVLHEVGLEVYQVDDGETFSVPLPGNVLRMWPMAKGLLVELSPEGALDVVGSPRLLALLHPLENFRSFEGVGVDTSTTMFLFVSDETPIALVQDGGTVKICSLHYRVEHCSGDLLEEKYGHLRQDTNGGCCSFLTGRTPRLSLTLYNCFCCRVHRTAC